MKKVIIVLLLIGFWYAGNAQNHAKDAVTKAILDVKNDWARLIAEITNLTTKNQIASTINALHVGKTTSLSNSDAARLKNIIKLININMKLIMSYPFGPGECEAHCVARRATCCASCGGCEEGNSCFFQCQSNWNICMAGCDPH